MWYTPSAPGLEPSVEQKAVEKEERTNRFLPLVSVDDKGALPILSDATVLSSFLEKGRSLTHALEAHRGAYLHLVGGGPVHVNGKKLSAMGAARIADEDGVLVRSDADAELLLADVLLI